MAWYVHSTGKSAFTCPGGNLTRIVSGRWGGRRLKVPGGRQVRPTAERVREAWLSIIAADLIGASVLDLFAGTGALGLEALSRGADSATFVEKNAAPLAALKENVATLDDNNQCTVQRVDAVKYVAGLSADAFDIALVDPPFDADYAQRVVDTWRETQFCNLLAVEHHPRTVLDGDDTRRWGDVAVTFLRNR